MKSLVGEVMAAAGRAVARTTTAADKPPLSYARAGYTGSLFGPSAPGDAMQNMQAMGAVGTLFAIVNLLSTSTAGVRWRLYRSAASGDPDDRVEVQSHLALDVWNRPNRFFTGRKLREVGQQHLDLTGECWQVIVTNPAMPGVPLGMWPVRPDRIEVVPSAENFIAGYVYHGPDGEKIPLGLDQVMGIQTPCPWDMYRGMGAVQSILADAESIAAAIAWNAAFFRQGAQPGGVISLSVQLSDEEFTRWQQRWAEGHRGVNNAHRVALLEQGATWQSNVITQNDMQFAELRKVSRDAVREAFRIHGHMLGDADDVNLSNATAAEITFGRRLQVPRLDGWKELANCDFLPKFGATAAGLEMDYDNPVSEDEESDASTFYDRARGVQLLVFAGFAGPDAAAAASLPEMAWNKTAVAHSVATIGGAEGGGSGPTSGDSSAGGTGGGGSGWESAPGNRGTLVGGRDDGPKG